MTIERGRTDTEKKTTADATDHEARAAETVADLAAGAKVPPPGTEARRQLIDAVFNRVAQKYGKALTDLAK